MNPLKVVAAWPLPKIGDEFRVNTIEHVNGATSVTLQPIERVDKQWRSDADSDYIARLESALRPLVTIAKAYHENALDESRPEAVERGVEEFRQSCDIELFQGRGGKQLLTLADCLEAERVVDPKWVSAKDSTPRPDHYTPPTKISVDTIRERRRAQPLRDAAMAIVEQLSRGGTPSTTVMVDLHSAVVAWDAGAPPADRKPGDDICINGRLFLRRLAETMGVIEPTADPDEVIPMSELMPKMLARAEEDRERWHAESFTATLPDAIDFLDGSGHAYTVTRFPHDIWRIGDDLVVAHLPQQEVVDGHRFDKMHTAAAKARGLLEVIVETRRPMSPTLSGMSKAQIDQLDEVAQELRAAFAVPEKPAKPAEEPPPQPRAVPKHQIPVYASDLEIIAKILMTFNESWRTGEVIMTRVKAMAPQFSGTIAEPPAPAVEAVGHSYDHAPAIKVDGCPACDSLKHELWCATVATRRMLPRQRCNCPASPHDRDCVTKCRLQATHKHDCTCGQGVVS